MTNRIKEEKSELRELMTAKRKSIDFRDKRLYDKDICQRLIELVSAKQPKVIHSFLPIKGEIDVTPFLKWLLEHKIKVVCPKVLPKRQLESITLQHFDEFDIGPFNTIHPAGNKVYSGEIDFVVMPGLAFDNELNRLGYGGGYYDRFLEKNKVKSKIAILYPFQLVDSVPVANHDIKVDQLLISPIPVRSHV